MRVEESSISRRRPGSWTALMLFGAVALCLGVSRARPLETAKDWTARGDEIVRLVRENFYDRRAAEAWAQRYAGYAAAADNERQFDKLTQNNHPY